MPLEKRLGFNNPLLRRVRRHATMATLFRAIEPASGDQPGWDGPEPVARTAVPPSPALLPAAWPVGVPTRPTVARTMADSTGAETAEPSSQVTSPPTSIPTIPPPVSPLTAPPVQPSPPHALQPEHQPVTQTNAKTDESSWRRLKTIFRKHQEKQAGEPVVPPAESEAAPAESPPGTTGQTTPAPTAPRAVEKIIPPAVQRQTDERPPGAPLPLDQSPPRGDRAELDVLIDSAAATVSQPSAPTIAPSPEAGDHANVAPEKHGGEAALKYPSPDDPTKTGEAPTVAKPLSGPDDKLDDAPGVVTTATILDAPPSKIETAVADPPIISRKAEGGDEPGQIGAAGDSPIRTDWEAAPHSDVQLAPTDAEQPLPLQAVWPVQVSEPLPLQESPAPALSPDQPAEPSSIKKSAGRLSKAYLPDNAAKVRDTLQRVASGQPSDSSIELIPPRRQRPVIPAKETTQAARPTSAPEPATAVQRQESKNAPRQLTGPSLIQTEIGALPADLWQLLGETPPSPPGTEIPATPETADPVQQTITKSEGPPPASRPLVQATADPLAPQTADPVQQTISEAGEPAAASPRPAMDKSSPPVSQTADRVQRAIARAEAPPVSTGQPVKFEATTSTPETAVPQTRKIVQPETVSPSPPAVAVPAITPMFIQREEQPAEEPTASLIAPGSETGESPESETAEKSAATEIDVDELARRVYGNIKRRLSVEWERVQGRF